MDVQRHPPSSSSSFRLRLLRVVIVVFYTSFVKIIVVSCRCSTANKSQFFLLTVSLHLSTFQPSTTSSKLSLLIPPTVNCHFHGYFFLPFACGFLGFQYTLNRHEKKISETKSTPFVVTTSSDNGLTLLDADDLFLPSAVMAILPFFLTTAWFRHRLPNTYEKSTHLLRLRKCTLFNSG